MGEIETVVVGAGLAGLACAARLTEAGHAFQVLEASDAVGGRVRTDLVDGFRLDRGFQVLLAAYPEARSVFDYAALDLHAFQPGALVRLGGAFHRVADPRRALGAALKSVLNPVGSFGDKLRIGRLVLQARRGSFASLFSGPESTVFARLREVGFSDGMIDGFFRPFLGGILLDASLSTSSYLLDFVLRMLAEGDTCVPGAGMGALSDQLAERVGLHKIRFGARVTGVNESGLQLESGERVKATRVVMAVEGPEAARLLSEEVEEPGSKGVTCLYFAADCSPVEGPWLVLNGEGEAAGPVSNLAVMSEVASSYSPEGQHLVAATVLRVPAEDDAALENKVRAQLTTWYGEPVTAWRHLRTYRIHHAQPDQSPGFRARATGARLSERLYVCGDYRRSASIQGALESGREAADALLGVVR
jgi:phytoene dehydrogenase-like protein